MAEQTHRSIHLLLDHYVHVLVSRELGHNVVVYLVAGREVGPLVELVLRLAQFVQHRLQLGKLGLGVCGSVSHGGVRVFFSVYKF